MENNPDKLIQDQYNSLPQDVKDAIEKVPWKDRVRDIAQREGLETDKVDILETETMLILYGFLPPETYIASLVSQVGVPEEQAERISRMVTAEIVEDIEKQFETIDAPAQVVAQVTTPSTEVPPTTPGIAVPTPTEMPTVVTPVSLVPELAPNILPETLPSESAHNTMVKEVSTPPQVPSAPVAEESVRVAEPTPELKPRSMIEEKLSGPTSASTSTPRSVAYPKGIDPYREPIV